MEHIWTFCFGENFRERTSGLEIFFFYKIIPLFITSWPLPWVCQVWKWLSNYCDLSKCCITIESHLLALLPIQSVHHGLKALENNLNLLSYVDTTNRILPSAHHTFHHNIDMLRTVIYIPLLLFPYIDIVDYNYNLVHTLLLQCYYPHLLTITWCMYYLKQSHFYISDMFTCL